MFMRRPINYQLLFSSRVFISKYLYPLWRSSVIRFRIWEISNELRRGVTSGQVWALSRGNLVFFEKKIFNLGTLLSRAYTTFQLSRCLTAWNKDGTPSQNTDQESGPDMNPVVDISTMPDLSKDADAIVSPGGPDGSRDLSPGPDLYCSVACPGRLSRPWWSFACSPTSGGALWGLLTSYWACQAGCLDISPAACRCSTIFRTGDAVVGLAQALPDLWGTSPSTKGSSSCTSSMQAAPWHLLRASSVSLVLAQMGLGRPGHQHAPGSSCSATPAPGASANAFQSSLAISPGPPLLQLTTGPVVPTPSSYPPRLARIFSRHV